MLYKKNVIFRNFVFILYLYFLTILFNIVIYKALCFNVAQGRLTGAPSETQTHLCRFASLAC